MPEGCPKDNLEKSNDSFGSIILSIFTGSTEIFKSINTHRTKLICMYNYYIMKDTIVQQCLDILKRDDVKIELKTMFRPVIDYVLYEIQPYIYITVTLVFLIFVMILAILFILILLLRNKQLLTKLV